MLQHLISDVDVIDCHKLFVFICKHVLIRNVCYSLQLNDYYPLLITFTHSPNEFLTLVYVLSLIICEVARNIIIFILY